MTNDEKGTAGRASEAIPMTKPVTYVSEVYPESWIFRTALVLGGVVIWLCFKFAPEWYWCALTIVVTVAIAGSVGWRAFVEPGTGVVREEARLFGRKLIAERRQCLKDFEAIVFRCSGGESDEWLVGIRHRSGRRIWLKNCGANDPALRPPGRFAEEFAWRLHCDTGLKIEEFPLPGRRHWLRAFLGRRTAI
jgi:hypothetical protein